MQKTRPRRTGNRTASETGAAAPVGTGRPKHVRTRLIVAVAVVAAAIAGAGAPALLTASGQLSDSQDLVTLAGRTQNALALAHSLADERDEVTSYIAAGRPKSKAPSEDRSARVDRQVEDLRADTDTPGWLRTDLDGIAAVRRSALTGQSTALQAYQAYSGTITELHRLATDLAEQMPPRAGSGAYALAELDSAVQQSAAARGLLLAALNIPTTTQTTISPITGLATTTKVTSEADRKQRDALTAAAQQARLRADAALADFRDTAPKTAVESYDSTVTGGDVNDADKYLAALTDQPTLSADDLGTGVKKLDAALSARVDLMRGVESALYDRRTKDLARLRDDDVKALEIRVAVVGALMLVAVGIATAMARSLTRPLSVVRRGSARLAGAEDPRTEEPITFTGRNDEFAQVVRSVNALHAHAVELYDRIATLETDRKHLVGQRQKMAEAREELRAEVTDAAAQLERLRTSIGSTFVNLALRTLGLVERQLAVIETLEEREQDPDRLSTLFKLDHFATVMRRHSENLLVLAGTEHVQQHAGPIPLVDVVRAAVSEIERYDRVRIASLPPHAHVAGFAADDLSHLLAELMENATASSPPDVPVEISGWLLESGEVMLSVQDEGIGMTADRMVRLNARLAEFDPESPYDQQGEDGLGLGLYVVARLAHRHGVRVQLREQKQGGVAAVVVLPQPLLAAAPVPKAPQPATTAAHPFSLPGADAEVNSNVLHGRTTGDPLVTLAEKAVQNARPCAPDPAAEGPGVARTEADAEAAGTRRADEDAAHGESAPPKPAEPEPTARPKAPAETFAETTMELLLPLEPTAETAPPEERDHPADADIWTRPQQTGTENVWNQHQAAPEPRPDSPPLDTGEARRSQPVGAENRAGLPPVDAVEGWRSQPTGAEDRAGSLPVDAVEGWRSPSAAAEDHSRPQQVGAGDPTGLLPFGAGDPAGSQPVGAEEGRRSPSAAEDVRSARQSVGGVEDHSRTRSAVAGGEYAPPGTPAADQERRTGGAGGDETVEGESEDPVTSKGLPKRTPKITAPAPPPRQRSTGVDADALRRRLGGFRRGADAGRRDVEAEIAEQTGQNKVPSTARTAPGTAVSEEATGGTVEEASS
ncbi:nitrate- and nitrite sensing domain-containing protein [Streptomyces sp. NPDC051987]|uniref:sensor histidine kinase n=1 Tax=Streptomyces sp. NPDC051987 TaxID=3155808 RepID=UPI00343F85D3